MIIIFDALNIEIDSSKISQYYKGEHLYLQRTNYVLYSTSIRSVLLTHCFKYFTLMNICR
jgi:hypothetical protein